MKKWLAEGLSVALLLCLPWAGVSACSKVTELKAVGEATLRVWGFSVYSARTLSCTGLPLINVYPLPKPFALELTYARAIAQQDLIKNTREQWQRLDLYSLQSEQWLEQLLNIWPSVQAGDRLTLYVNDAAESQFYLDDRFIGTISDARFGEQFSAIWLAEGASYPKVRRALLGVDL